MTSFCPQLRAFAVRRFRLLTICVVVSLALLGWGSRQMKGAAQSRGNWLAFASQLFAAPAPQNDRAEVMPGNYDIRINGQADLGKVIEGNSVGKVTVASRSRLKAQAQVQVRSLEQGLTRLRQVAPDAEIKLSGQLGTVEMVSAVRGLTPPTDGTGEQIVRAYLRQNKAVYGLTDSEIGGLRYIGESNSGGSGLRMVRVEQTVNGYPVFQSETRFILSPEGRVVRSLGLLAPNASVNAAPIRSLIDAPTALQRAMASVGVNMDSARLHTSTTKAASGKITVSADDPQIKDGVESKLVYFPAAPGVLIPAWSQITFAQDADWYTLVDARTGVLLWRKNIRDYVSTQPARFSVYVQADGKTPADSPAPQSPAMVTPGAGTQFLAIVRTIVNMLSAQDSVASPAGWIPDGGNTTSGNNVDAYLDRVGGAGEENIPDLGALDNNGRPVGNPDANSLNRDFFGSAPRNFDYTPAPLAGNPDAGDDPTGNTATQTAFRRGAVTQLFYVTNWYHDRLFSLGFDEAAGNFQLSNFSGLGAGNDRVLAECQDSSGTDNANFSTPPDGTSGRLQMYRFVGATPARDGSLDSDVVVHELTHGLTNRLIGNSAGLVWDPGRGMGEGWSDFYALSLLNNTNADDPNGRYTSGAYTTYKLNGYPSYTDNYVYGIRRFPYSTDNTVNPLTWADLDGTSFNLAGGITPSPIPASNGGEFEVHNIGEIWALTLWEVRSRVIADPAGANGNVPTGNQTMLQLVTDALKMTPSNPSFTDARDALLAADCATNACANEKAIWEGFADRGLGYKAVAPLGVVGAARAGTRGHEGVGESFSVPYLDVLGTTVNDSAGNNNGAIDPGEPIKLTVKLMNPWRNAALGVASAAATLTTSTPGVVIYDNTSAYGPIPANGSADGDTFLFTVPTNAACGQALKFTLQSISALGTASVEFTLRVGLAGGTGAPLTYTRLVPGGLSIPDGNLLGVTDTFTISDDYEIADLNFRVDDLSHTWSGDLAVMLRAPNGYGTDLIHYRGLFIGVPYSAGENFVNTVIDDQAGFDFDHDLNLTTPDQAPFTGSWLPAFNSPIWYLFGIPGFEPDLNGQLSRLNGQSTQGSWKVHVTDRAASDFGTLNAWSLIVTPRAYTCAAFTPTAAVRATKSVSGLLVVGSPITYTITLTNTGNGGQADNPGNEFTDVLPATLTLVSANATAGTAVANVGTNTVTWNGSIAPLGGSVTLTIQAVINGSANGQNVSNQGLISYDADVNGSNEASGVTDNPATVAPNDPTSFLGVCPAYALSALPNGALNSTYNQTLSVTPNLGGPFNFTFTGMLPPGLQLSSSGVLSGTPTALGTYNFTVTATAATGCRGSQLYLLTIGCNALTFTPASLPAAQAGVAYSQSITVSPTGSYSFSLMTGNLPPGLLLNTATGVLSGTATATGTYNFILQVIKPDGCRGTQAYALVVTCPPITVNPTELPTGTTGTAYSQSFNATPASSYNFSKTSGTLPPGLNLSATGSLSGTPTTAGTYTFTVTATGFGTCTGSRQFTVTIGSNCSTITLPVLPTTGKVGVSYSGNLAATTPSGSYTFSIDSGALPPGLTLNSLFATLSGKPTAVGTYNFTLKATRSNGCVGTRPYTVVIGSNAAVAQVRTPN